MEVKSCWLLLINYRIIYFNRIKGIKRTINNVIKLPSKGLHLNKSNLKQNWPLQQ